MMIVQSNWDLVKDLFRRRHHLLLLLFTSVKLLLSKFNISKRDRERASLVHILLTRFVCSVGPTKKMKQYIRVMVNKQRGGHYDGWRSP